MADPGVLVGSFLLVAVLLIAAAVVGHGAVETARLLGGDTDRFKTWGTRLSLLCTTAAAVVVSASAVVHLSRCAPGVPSSCSRDAVVARLPAPVAGVPALDLTLRVDGLAALFLLVVGVCTVGVAVYSVGWLSDDPLRHVVAGSFALFVAATLLVLVVDNAFWLFVGLESVTLFSADLVLYRGRRGGSLEASRLAVRTYLIVSHVGLVCLLAGLLPVAVRHGSLDFEVLDTAGGSPVPAVSFALVLAGLVARAGIVPLHFWVPVVHPQLPTNTHAMMSAVMLKIAVYLMIRLFFRGVLGTPAWWWGATVLVLAGVTVLVTVFYALISKDLKTAFAYHSVENVGICLIGVGLALMFSDPSLAAYPAARAAAAVALLAALYHVVNHALFKTLLFLCTGHIERITGTVELRALGGLLRRAPWMGITFLVGAVAISGLPPLNGFVSEWLTFQALFGGQISYHERGPVSAIGLGAVMVALIALGMAVALTAMALLKIVGEALLGAPRAPGVRPRGAGWTNGVLAVLALMCVTLGVQPWLLVPWLSAAVGSEQLDASALQATPRELVLDLSRGSAASGDYRVALPVLPLVLLGVVPVVLGLALRVRRGSRRPVWVGGEPFRPADMRYPGTAFTALIWTPMSRDTRQILEAPLPTIFRMSARRVVVEQANHWVDCALAAVLGVAERVGDQLQNGDVRRYLLYIFCVVVLVLTLLIVLGSTVL